MEKGKLALQSLSNAMEEEGEALRCWASSGINLRPFRRGISINGGHGGGGILVKVGPRGTGSTVLHVINVREHATSTARLHPHSCVSWLEWD